ncbi:MAG: hypothetical protein V1818_01645 [Candidatus Aenigmatarchaeota archaeon]
MDRYERLVDGLTRKNRKIYKLGKEEREKRLERINEYYLRRPLDGEEPNRVSSRTLEYLKRKIGIETTIEDYWGKVTFTYPNESNGGMVTTNDFIFRGVFTEPGGYGIVTGDITSEDKYELIKKDAIGEEDLRKNKQIIGRLVAKGIAKN